MKKTYIFLIGLATMMTISCDRHRDFPDISMKTGHIVLTNGKVVSPDEYQKGGGTAIAVVFHVKQSEEETDLGYAVYLRDVVDLPLCDSIGTRQNTSTDVTAMDGNANTYALYASGFSPAADKVYDLWHYGQSAYIPSVAQLKLLCEAKDIINPIITMCGGDPLPDKADECWYWSSTEVENQERHKAWLYSISSGALQETPKEQAHKIRPIITIYE